MCQVCPEQRFGKRHHLQAAIELEHTAMSADRLLVVLQLMVGDADQGLSRHFFFRDLRQA